MMRYLSCILTALALFCSSCLPEEFRECPNTHKDPVKQFYNDALVQIIEHRLNRAYLPVEDQQAIWRHFQNDAPHTPTAIDSAWLQKKEVLFQNRLFLDTARFQVFYLNTWPLSKYLKLAQLPTHFSEFEPASEIAGFITALAPKAEQTTLDSLASIQRVMQANEFRLCTAALLPAKPRSSNDGRAQRDVLTLSSVVFNARKDNALLAYSWVQGPRSGFGEVVLLEKIRGRWRIKQAVQTWIS